MKHSYSILVAVSLVAALEGCKTPQRVASDVSAAPTAQTAQTYKKTGLTFMDTMSSKVRAHVMEHREAAAFNWTDPVTGVQWFGLGGPGFSAPMDIVQAHATCARGFGLPAIGNRHYDDVMKTDVRAYPPAEFNVLWWAVRHGIPLKTDAVVWQSERSSPPWENDYLFGAMNALAKYTDIPSYEILTNLEQSEYRNNRVLIDLGAMTLLQDKVDIFAMPTSPQVGVLCAAAETSFDDCFQTGCGSNFNGSIRSGW